MEETVRTINVRWQGATGGEREHLVLRESESGIVAESVYLSRGGGEAFGVWYRIQCDPHWHVQSFEANVIGTDRRVHLKKTEGHWENHANGTGSKLLEVPADAADVDLSITPFTNTIPIRRLKLSEAESRDITVVYLKFPELEIFPDPQRYTRLASNKYLFDSVDSDFQAELEVDQHGLVVHYPNLFIRIS